VRPCGGAGDGSSSTSGQRRPISHLPRTHGRSVKNATPSCPSAGHKGAVEVLVETLARAFGDNRQPWQAALPGALGQAGWLVAGADRVVRAQLPMSKASSRWARRWRPAPHQAAQRSLGPSAAGADRDGGHRRGSVAGAQIDPFSQCRWRHSRIQGQCRHQQCDRECAGRIGRREKQPCAFGPPLEAVEQLALRAPAPRHGSPIAEPPAHLVYESLRRAPLCGQPVCFADRAAHCNARSYSPADPGWPTPVRSGPPGPGPRAAMGEHQPGDARRSRSGLEGSARKK